ncbi:hypothetical protein E3N88_32193 [Mikania micrantha]|uniref:Uncharacterized protein n=1 Tax=Mikania micrantha TaxID=192012 RepID=A0A5N6M7U1_9ASTR|nr:hypothetical protein E3N88_32193 [Mikania micrantha]
MITKDIDDVKFEDLLKVDAVIRLGLDYHYENEINLILERCYHQFIKKDLVEHTNLYEVSICFRILRQNGFHVSADVFELFKGKNGEFVESMKHNDTKGLVELYEASHLCIEGENILDEAAIFSSHMLEKSLKFLDDEEARMVKYALENPHRRNITHFTLLNSSRDCDAIMLKELAKLESEMVQSTRRKEINEILRWWKDLGLWEDLNLARNQPLKWYIVPMVCLANPSFSQERIDLTKIVSLIYILDDIFDIYGTVDELTLLTEAINKWDTMALEQLPHYMRSSFKVLYDTTSDIAYKVYEKHGFNPMKDLQKSWATLCEAFLVEAKWFSSRHIPKSEEYLKNGIISSGVEVFLVHMLFFLGDGVTKENAKLIYQKDIIPSVSKILRLTDDLEAEQNENQDGQDGSYVKCFLLEHEKCSKNIVKEYVRKMISDTWKSLNKECLSPNPFSEDFLKGSLNLARLVPSMYGYKCYNSFDMIEEYVKSIL